MIGRSRRPGREDGMAIISVVGVLAVTTLFLMVSLTFVLTNATAARKDTNSKVALSAAQAGIDEYVSRLNANSSYWQGGNSDSGNSAFGTGQVIQGTGTSGASYAYQVLSTASETAKSGLIRLKVTGTSPTGSGTSTTSRSLVATLKPKGFLNFGYLSDMEVVDPDIAGDPAACKQYYYAGRSTTSGCSNIQWATGDVVSGPLHSNDALQINGSVNFTDRDTETSWPATKNATGSTKTWWGTQGWPLAGYPPVYYDKLDLPSANSSLLQYVSPDVDGSSSTPPGPGCYYQGATKIVLSGTTMTVLSPGTTKSGTPTTCYDITKRTVEQTVPIPPVIYVDAGTTACTIGAIGYPAATEDYTSGSGSAIAWGHTTNYNCQHGTVFVQGTASGQVTIAAQDDVVVTGDVKLADATGTDVIGLIAGNCVWVYHPIDNGNELYSAPRVSTIQAAVLALRHSFLVQNWDQGSPRGTLSVLGAIAQKFRGPVGTGGTSIATGYKKSYDYDERLAQVSPPYFLKSASAKWTVWSVTDAPNS